MASKRELDPLLPQNDPAPEILGSTTYGSRQVKRNRLASFEQPPPPAYAATNDAEDEQDSPMTSTRSALSTIISIFTVVVFFAFLALLLSPDDESGISPLPRPRPARTVEQRVSNILEGTPLIDGHNDLAIFVRGAYKNKIHTKEFRSKFENGGMGFNVDLPRLKSGKNGGAFWSAFVVCRERK